MLQTHGLAETDETVNQQEGRAAIAGNDYQRRERGDQYVEAADADQDQNCVGQGANQADQEYVFVFQALLEDESVLRADRENQRKSQ